MQLPHSTDEGTEVQGDETISPRPGRWYMEEPDQNPAAPDSKYLLLQWRSASQLKKGG